MVAVLGARLFLYLTGKRGATLDYDYDYDDSAGGGETGPLENRRVALFGDSLSGGLAYRRELSDLLGATSVVSAFSYQGQQTSVIESHVNDVLSWNPTDAVVLAGVNDLAGGKTVDHVVGNLDDIYMKLRERGIRVVAVALTPWAGNVKGAGLQTQTRAVNSWILYDSPADAVVDTSSLGDAHGAAFEYMVGADGLHLNGAGQTALATEVHLRGFAGG